MRPEAIRTDCCHWFVMRDLKRSNAKLPAYKMLKDMGYKVFTPMRWRLSKRGGRNEKVLEPVIRDLLFVNSSREELDPVVEEVRTLQYRFQKGAPRGSVMEVPVLEMERFMAAVGSIEEPVYYGPEEIQPSMIGKKVEVVGGALHGYVGHLLAVKGVRKKRIILQLPGIISVAVEVNPEYIKIVK
ncbi:MAG: UpxY family transcription antiterminator [Paramuribaculum sp.]|nr:UpxY family transcription antiterminator [Paramuribaculum sp.]